MQQFEAIIQLLLLSLIICIVQSAPLSPVVTTKSGAIRGQLLQTSRGEIYQFTAIPFAEPPTGQRRFKRPVPITPWGSSTVLDATKRPEPCMQPGDGSWPTIGSEDCLYLNIWAPKWAIGDVVANNGQPLLSTYVFIHGGGFMPGSGSFYNGTILTSFNNVIVVEIQYRLASLGFAYYGTEEMPGNMGLWDQLEALKWVFENIDAFGGNKNSITIGGHSAGSASVTFHMLSPKSRRFFQRAIVESGTAIAPWATHTQRQAMNVTDLMLQNILSRKICSETSKMSSVTDKTRCLMSVDAAILQRALPGFGASYFPVIDGDFVPNDPMEMLQSGNFYKIPLLIGVAKDEGSLLLGMTPKGYKMLPTPFNQPFNQAYQTVDESLDISQYRILIQDAFDTFMPGLVSSLTPLVSQAIELQYWPRKHDEAATELPHGTEIAIAASNVVGDSLLLCPTYGFAQKSANFSNVYVYYFTHRRAVSTDPEWMGVTHGSELPFVFGFPLFLPDQSNGIYTREDAYLSLVMMTYWANFVKYGDPNIGDGGVAGKNDIQLPKWPTHMGDNCPSRVLEISTKLINGTGTNEAVLCGLKAGDCLFWQDYFPKILPTANQGAQLRLKGHHIIALLLLIVTYANR